MLNRSDLRHYQERAVQFIKDTPNCALWLDMGMGKSVSTLTAINDLRESFDTHKTLVIAPKRVARDVWSDEIQEWDHLQHLTTSRILGTEKQRLAGLSTSADIHLINRENVVWLRDQLITGTGKKMKLIRKWPWDTIVIDESSSFKSQSSKRWKALRSLRKLFDRCVELTGTPAPNGYGDLWAQINLLDRGQRLGYSEKAFKERWMDPPSRWDPGSVWTMKPGAREEIQRILGDVVIAMQAEDYLELPPVLNNPVRVKFSPYHMKQYRDMERKYMIELAGKKVTAVNAGVLAGKLLQLANGAIYYDGDGNYEEFHSYKLEACEELLEQSQGPVILAYNFKSDEARLCELVKRWAKRNGKTWAVYETEEHKEQWNNDEIDVLLLHPQSGGHGLNLHKGSSETIIWYGLIWSLEFYQQLNARLAGGHRRAGKNVVIHHIMAENTIDEVVMRRLGDKDADQNNLTEAMKERIREVTR